MRNHEAAGDSSSRPHPLTPLRLARRGPRCQRSCLGDRRLVKILSFLGQINFSQPCCVFGLVELNS